jgi:hypothetical protein
MDSHWAKKENATRSDQRLARKRSDSSNGIVIRNLLAFSLYMDFLTKDNGLQSNTLKHLKRDQHCNALHSLTTSKDCYMLQWDMIRRAQLILPKPKKLVRLDNQVSRPLQSFRTSMKSIHSHLSSSSPPLLSPVQFAALGHQSQTSRHLCNRRHPRCCRQSAAHGHSKQ